MICFQIFRYQSLDYNFGIQKFNEELIERQKLIEKLSNESEILVSKNYVFVSNDNFIVEIPT